MHRQSTVHDSDAQMDVLTAAPVLVACPISEQTEIEERVNVWTHGVGLLFGLIGFVLLAIKSAALPGFWPLFVCSVYATTLVMMFASSTLYHSVRRPDLKRWFQTTDHICIYFLIAGTLTPFSVLVLKSSAAYYLLWLLWGVTLVGSLAKLFSRRSMPALSLATYLGMGWSALYLISPLKEALSVSAFSLLVSGGAFYSVGTIFYANKKIPFNHGIWHLFVMAGAACHYFSLYLAIFST